MSDATADAERDGFWERLPEWLRPREHERRGRGDLRRIESTLLVFAFLLLAVAVVNDVVLQTHVNYRITADLRGCRELTGHESYHNISVEQDLVHHTTRDVLCGNIEPGPPGALPQICLIMTGPVRHGQRASHGGFYLPPYTPDKRISRYACFGAAVGEDLCGAATPPGALHAPVPGADGSTPRPRAWWPLALLLLLAAGAAARDARPAELLVRRGVHAGARPAREPRGDAAAFVHTENTPPLWYVAIWGWARLFGTGEVALRCPRRSPGSRRCRSRGGSAASSPGAARRS